jgi:cell division septum initiation protein DivIVA
MDILHLVDRLEEIINSSRSLPFTHSIILDEDRVLELIDQMRVSIPEEVKKAKKVLGESERIKADAKEEAERTLGAAREQSAALVDREPLIAATQTRADQILQQARVNADVIQNDADQYVVEVLSDLEAHLIKILNQVRNGIDRVKTERGAELEKTH